MSGFTESVVEPAAFAWLESIGAVRPERWGAQINMVGP
jgi:hypothetical protein